MPEMSLKQKKQRLLYELVTEFRKQGIYAELTYLIAEQCITICNEHELNDRTFTISLDNLSTVKVVANYVEFSYENNIDSRRNAIKTAKDVFEFCHELQAGNYTNISEKLHGVEAPKLALYYRNSPSANAIIITSTQRYDLSNFIPNAATHLTELNNKLNKLTKLIALDNEGKGRELRWEREVSIGKKWWNH